MDVEDLTQEPNAFYIPPRKDLKWLAVDLDGTLCWPTWKPDQKRSVIGDVIPENYAKLMEAHFAGYNIIIHTARHWTDYEMIEAWLNKHEIPHRGIICGKILSAAYIDDKSINARAASWIPPEKW